VEGLEGDATADIMAVSALISLDLSKKRVKDYKFSWERALASSNKLQYSHARLFSLLDACTPLLPPLNDGHIATETLTEFEALELAFQIARWDEILSLSATTLEPQHIVTYLFNLVSSTSKALGSLQVKPVIDSSPEVARARLLLFDCAKKVLAEGMRVLGIEPLDRV